MRVIILASSQPEAQYVAEMLRLPTGRWMRANMRNLHGIRRSLLFLALPFWTRAYSIGEWSQIRRHLQVTEARVVHVPSSGGFTPGGYADTLLLRAADQKIELTDEESDYLVRLAKEVTQ